MHWADEIDSYHQKYADKMDEDGIDLLLVPGSIIPAPDKVNARRAQTVLFYLKNLEAGNSNNYCDIHGQ